MEHVYTHAFNGRVRSQTSAPPELVQPLYVAGVAVGMSICYEQAFAYTMAERAAGSGWLVNVSDDAWICTAYYRNQMLATARLRAMEVAKPLLRVTSGGRSVLIDATGRVTALLGSRRRVFHVYHPAGWTDAVRAGLASHRHDADRPVGTGHAGAGVHRPEHAETTVCEGISDMSMFRKPTARSATGRRSRGASMIEFAIVFPIAALFVLGLIQLGFMYMARLTLNHATFIAAREGSIHNANSAVIREALIRGLSAFYQRQLQYRRRTKTGLGIFRR